MGKSFKITEQQYGRMLEEGIKPTLQMPQRQDGTPDISQARSDASKVDGGCNFTLSSDSLNGSQTNEHRIITKRELQEGRKRYLKENSEILSLNEFLSRLH